MTPADQIYSLPTNLGTAKLAYALANNLTVQISHMAIGDGNGAVVNPTATATALVREVHRAQLNQLSPHPENPNWLVAELVIPAEVGGWTIREIGLYDVDGDLIFVGNHAEQYKPVQSQGSDETKTIRMVILVSSLAAVTLRTDPTTVMATIKFVNDSVAAAATEATQEQAEAGTDGTRKMTPRRVWQAISKRFSTKEQAEAGTDDSTLMSPLRVFQAIGKVVAQASQATAGIALIATKTKTIEGTDDQSIITPYKLRWGVTASLGVNGYIALPTWLFGFIFQWGRFDAPANQVGTVPFPLAFVNDCFYGEIVLQRTAANATVKRVEGLSSTALSYNFDSWSTTYPTVTHRWFAFGV